MIIDVNAMIGKRKIKPEITASELLDAMNMAKVDKAVIYCFAPVLDNDSVLNAISENEDRFIGLYTVNPWEETAVKQLESAFDNGFKGLHLDAVRHGFAMNELELLAPLIEVCDQAGFPVWAYGAAEVFSTPILFQEIAQNFPNVPFIMGHMGYIYETSSAMGVASRNKNIYLDLTGSMYSHIKKAMRLVPVDQILFGSGTPDYGTFDTEIEKIEEAVDEENIRELILGKNAAKIFGIEI